MTPAERNELLHIATVTRDAPDAYTYRTGDRLLDGLVRRGLVERAPRGEDKDTYYVYRVTRAGLDALEGESVK